MSDTASPLAEHGERLDRICREVVAPNAARVDQEGAFPREAVDALGEAGLLGLVGATEVGGLGGTLKDAAFAVERLARECGSTAMVVGMHYAGAAVVEAHGGPEDVRRGLADGSRLTTLAFSEAGSRSHFWAPLGTAREVPEGVRLDARKSWVTSSREATDYVWSSRALDGEGVTIWLVPRDAAGLSVPGPFDGLGLRGNDSTPVTAEGVVVPAEARLGDDGGGFAVMMETVLPIFNFMNAGCSVGLMTAACARAIEHVSGTRHAHLDSSLADLPTIRAYVARMRLDVDAARAFLTAACDAALAGQEDAALRVLESKALCGEAALAVCDTAMRVCGGAAFRKDVGVERYFRDARAGSVMAPTSDVLYDFIGKAVCGLPLF